MMKQITKKEFWDAMGSLQGVEARVRGNYPYTTEIRCKTSRKVYGEIKTDYTDGIPNKYPVVKTYHIFHRNPNSI